jgi:hypothetical protein
LARTAEDGSKDGQVASNIKKLVNNFFSINKNLQKSQEISMRIS